MFISLPAILNWHSFLGLPFKNDKFKQKDWMIPSKFKIALAVNTTTKEDVVLKLYDVKHDYENELSYLQDLNKSDHARRFVVKLLGTEEPIDASTEQRYGIVLEVLGDNLHEYLSTSQHLNRQTRVALALNLVEAVDAIHRAGVAHCDLKPHQVCFTRRPGIELKLLGFDSARYIKSFEPLDRFTMMYAAPEVVRAAAAGKLSTLTPTKAVDLWALGLMLVQIFHPGMEPVFKSEEDAEKVLQGDDPMVFISKRISDLGSSRSTLELLLTFSPNERKSASVVLKENTFQTGAFTIFTDLKQGQDEGRTGVEDILAGQAELLKAVKATQRMIVEYGDMPVPRMAMLVPDDMAQGHFETKDFFRRLASDAGAVKYYNLYFLCEGCTLFASTECSCGSGSAFNEPVRVEMPGAMVKDLAPALKVAAMFYKMISVASSVAGVRLPLELPGVNDVFEFAEGVNDFVEWATTEGAPPSRAAAAEGREPEASMSVPGTRASGPAYAALAALLKRSDAAPMDNTCQGLLKVADQNDGNVYWVCKAHAHQHSDRLLNASTSSYEKDVGIYPLTAPEKEAYVATATPMSITDSLEGVMLVKTTQKNAVSRLRTNDKLHSVSDNRLAMRHSVLNLWASGDSLAASKQVGELVKQPWSIRAVTLTLKAEELAAAATIAASAVAKIGPAFPAVAKLDPKSDTQNCKACGVKLSGFRVSMVAAVKHRCRSCGCIICNACSPSQLEVLGYSTPQRVCTPCVEAKSASEAELKADATEAEKRSAVARAAAQKAVIDDAASAPELKEGSAALYLTSMVEETTAAGMQVVASELQLKLNNVGKKSLVLAIQQETLRLPLLREVFEAIDKDKSGSVGCYELATFGQVRNAVGSRSAFLFQDLPLPSHYNLLSLIAFAVRTRLLEI